jgi:hypothetical protein
VGRGYARTLPASRRRQVAETGTAPRRHVELVLASTWQWRLPSNLCSSSSYPDAVGRLSTMPAIKMERPRALEAGRRGSPDDGVPTATAGTGSPPKPRIQDTTDRAMPTARSSPSPVDARGVVRNLAPPACGVRRGGKASQSGWPAIHTNPVAFTLLIPWSAHPFFADPQKLSISSLFVAWSQPGSNRRPPACKAGALPTELWPRWPPSLTAIRVRPAGGAGSDSRRRSRPGESARAADTTARCG